MLLNSCSFSFLYFFFFFTFEHRNSTFFNTYSVTRGSGVVINCMKKEFVL
ncbi:uncharacterized protein DS421_8g227960 [Arachis hypogaea]|nr:uncharacterized protein DS421_8g227960 [Arachis hypogaea]